MHLSKNKIQALRTLFWLLVKHCPFLLELLVELFNLLDGLN